MDGALPVHVGLKLILMVHFVSLAGRVASTSASKIEKEFSFLLRLHRRLFCPPHLEAMAARRVIDRCSLKVIHCM